VADISDLLTEIDPPKAKKMRRTNSEGCRPGVPSRKPSCSFDELKEAGSLPIRLGDHLVGHVEPRRFSNGSYGLSFNGLVTIPLPDG
jgi:hypothetical protein